MSADFLGLRAAVAGAGFIGAVHVDALRRLGVEVVGVAVSPERVAAGEAPADAYASFEQLLADDRVDVVHLATPNHLHHGQARAALAAGKHVVCDKPLALTSAQSRELVELARSSGRVCAVVFMSRFYPQARQARALVANGSLGSVFAVHGSYLQDWLLYPTDWNWRLDPAVGGSLRAVADIGSHWLDLVQFVAGRRVEAVCAELATFLPVRRRPGGPVRTFARAGDGETVEVEMTTEDAAYILLRLEGGARGAVTISQVSAGRKNALCFEVDGSEGSVAWRSERPEELWVGRRDRPSELLLRDPALLAADAAAATRLPGGHAEGFAETFRELFRAVYTAAAGGEGGYPTFADGHRSLLLGEAIARSAREGRWVEVAG